MRTIFDGLVEEFRAWHLFEQQAGNPPQRDLRHLPGLGLPGYGAGGSSRPDNGTLEPGAEFGGSEYGSAGYFDRAPRYGWDLDEGAQRPDGHR